MGLISWFRSSLKTSDPVGPDLDESSDRIEYVDALLKMMLKKSLFSLRLTASEPLPRIENADGSADSPPNYQAVINRLKVMSRLDPIAYPTPVQGKIEVPCGSHILVYETHFEDKASPPVCQINLRVRRE